LYVANAGSKNISVYSFDSTTGVTTQLVDSPFVTTSTPIFATVDPAGNFLYVGGQPANNIVRFQINQTTGGLPSNTVAATTDLAPAAMAFGP
jgi:6-phosphogluconolactonase